MKKHKKLIITLIVVIVIIIFFIVFFTIKNKSSKSSEEIPRDMGQFIGEDKKERTEKGANGIYLVAPYDCYITELNLPDLNGKILNSHYVGIASSNSLMVTMNVDETNIEKISVGLEATIDVTSLSKTYKGNIAHIASTGDNGKFEIEIEFENDGDVKLGMTGAVSITI